MSGRFWHLVIAIDFEEALSKTQVQHLVLDRLPLEQIVEIESENEVKQVVIKDLDFDVTER